MPNSSTLPRRLRSGGRRATGPWGPSYSKGHQAQMTPDQVVAEAGGSTGRQCCRSPRYLGGLHGR